MSLDNFKLPLTLIPELYKDSLVVLESKQITNKLLKESRFVTLGNNKGKILLIVRDENAVYLGEDDLNFLVGILSACKLTIDDIALLNLHKNEGATYQSLMKEFKPHTVISFGIDLSSLDYPLEFPEYQLQKYNKQTYLSAPSLKALGANVAEKKKLWGCLKTLFSV